jgi:iduronate 2-sulfatase
LSHYAEHAEENCKAGEYITITATLFDFPMPSSQVGLMMPRIFSVLLVITVLLGPLGLVAMADTKPNVLFIVADDLRTELGCYGSHAKTPHLDALAKRGVRFDRAYCQQAVCNPSRSSFLTGRRPDTLHLWNNGTHFREKNPAVTTLPLWFKTHGYTTRCVGKIFHNWHTAEKGDRRSWSADEFLHYATHGDDTPRIDEANRRNLTNHATEVTWPYTNTRMTECLAVPDEAYYDGRVAAEAVKTLATRDGQPFFVAVGFWKPHAPFNAPKKYWDLYRREELPKLNVAKPTNNVPIAFHDSREILGIPPNANTPTAAQMAEMRHGYFANISYLDAQVGKVLTALEASGLANTTHIVFISDHGYHIGEHTLWGKTSCFESDTRVPMMIVPASTSQLTAQGVASSLVELVDLFPTLNELCGLPAPPSLDGTSLVPVLRNRTTSVKSAAYSQHPRPAYFDRTPTKTPEAMGYSVRTATHRYTEWRTWTDGQLLGAELYNHANDATELRNVVADGTESSALATARVTLHAMFPRTTPPAKR